MTGIRVTIDIPKEIVERYVDAYWEAHEGIVPTEQQVRKFFREDVRRMYLQDAENYGFDDAFNVPFDFQ